MSYHYCRRCSVQELSKPFDGKLVKSSDTSVTLQFKQDRWKDVVTRSLTVQEIKYKAGPEHKLIIYCKPCDHEV